jgi:hypothetical protein
MKDAGEHDTRDQTVSVPSRGTLAFFLVFFMVRRGWLCSHVPIFSKKKFEGFLAGDENRSDSFGDPIYVISSTSSSTSTRGRRRRSQAMQKMTKSKTKMQKRLLDLDSYGWKKENAKNDDQQL